MTNTNWRGPTNSMGAMEDSSPQTDDGPNYVYQGTVFPDLRATLFNKDGVGQGRVPGFLDNPQIVTVDNIPSAATTTAIAAANNTTTGPITSGTAMTLVTVAPGNAVAGTPSIATGVPLIPLGSSTVTTAAIALDFGFTTGTTTAASSSVVVVNTALFSTGQWIAIGGAGNSGKTATLLTQVTGFTNATTMTISPVALGSLTNAPIGSANLWNNLTPPSTQFGPATSTAGAVSPYVAGGMFRVFNPPEALSRTIAIATTNTSGAGGAFIVSGWDIYGQPMSESITVAAGTTASAYGKKAFKYIKNVIPQFTDATGSYSVGVSDVFGFPIRMDRYEYLNFCYSGINASNTSGFIAAVLSTATNTTGDVRGTLQVSTVGSGIGTGVINSALASNNTSRLWMCQTLSVYNDLAGTPTNVVPFYGVTQA